MAAHREGRDESALESTPRRCRRARVGGLGQSEARRVRLEGEEQQGASVVAPGADETSRGWLLRVSSRRRAHGRSQLALTCVGVLLISWGVSSRAHGRGKSRARWASRGCKHGPAAGCMLQLGASISLAAEDVRACCCWRCWSQKARFGRKEGVMPRTHGPAAFDERTLACGSACGVLQHRALGEKT